MLAADTVVHNRYRVVRQIGQGGMGAIYEAVDLHLGNRVALKQTLVSGAQFDRAFEREAKLLASLHHQALPVVSDYFSDANAQFLVMQFIPGDDLAALLARSKGPFALADVLRFADQLLDVLDYLHTQEPPVIHRDIKPQNIKLTPRGGIVLLDFGLAKGNVPLHSQLNQSKSLLGYTPQYAPLEQIQGSGTDARSDIYSLAATLYHLVTGTLPSDALTRVAAVVRSEPDPLRPLHEVIPDIPPYISHVLMAALATNPDARPASAAAMRAALQRALPHPWVMPTVTTEPTVVVPALQDASLRTLLPTVLGKAAAYRGWLIPTIAISALLVLLVIGVVGSVLWSGLRNQAASGASPAGSSASADATTPGTLTPMGAPTGRIVFMSTRDGNQDIYVVNVDGSGLKRLTTDPTNDLAPTWSPSGEQIAFVANRDGSSEIYVMNADGSDQHRLTVEQNGSFSPAWSPDGSKIAYIAEGGGGLAVFTMSVDGSDVTQVTNSEHNAGEPAWSPDSKRIAFVSARDFSEGSFDIYVISVDGTGLQRLTENPAIDTDPAWSPDGRRIAFMSTRNGNAEIHIMNADGSDQKYLTLNGVDDVSPTWSQDGRWLAFASQRDGKLGIFIMDSDGLNQTSVVTDTRDNFAPSWTNS